MPIRTITLALALAGLTACNTPEAPPSEPVAEKATPAKAAEPATPEKAAEPASTDAKAAFEARAKAATGTLKKTLMGALQGAMKEGPAAAVTACNTKAPEITRAAASAGVTVGRTATRLRNGDNAPAPWLKPLLEEYAALPAAEAKPRVVEIEGGGLGYVEPLYVNGLCLTCHGQPAQIPDDVKEKLAALYPQDAATGYEAGAFRGLVWATGE